LQNADKNKKRTRRYYLKEYIPTQNEIKRYQYGNYEYKVRTELFKNVPLKELRYKLLQHPFTRSNWAIRETVWRADVVANNPGLNLNNAKCKVKPWNTGAIDSIIPPPSNKCNILAKLDFKGCNSPACKKKCSAMIYIVINNTSPPTCDVNVYGSHSNDFCGSILQVQHTAIVSQYLQANTKDDNTVASFQDFQQTLS